MINRRYIAAVIPRSNRFFVHVYDADVNKFESKGVSYDVHDFLFSKGAFDTFGAALECMDHWQSIPKPSRN